MGMTTMTADLGDRRARPIGPARARLAAAILVLGLAASPSCKGDDRPAQSEIPAPSPTAQETNASERPTAPAETGPPETAPPSPSAREDPPPQTDTRPRLQQGSPTRELAEEILDTRGANLLDVQHLLRRVEIPGLTGFEGPLSRGTLEGQPPSSDYNTIRYGGADHLGVTIQVWTRPTARETSEHFQRLVDTYPVTREGPRIADDSFYANFSGIRQLVFMSRSQGTVVVVACDQQVCDEQSDIVRLAEQVAERL
jgi:hypothetical protein